MVHEGVARGIRGVALFVALGLLANACSSSDSVDASALPPSGARTVGTAADAALVAKTGDLAAFDDGNGHGEELDASYRIGIRETESIVTASLDDTFPRDQIVDASFTTNDSPEDTGFGVTCRVQDPRNFYRLGVGNDGTFAIARVQDGKSTVLTGEGKWVRDTRIKDAPGAFKVHGECVGTTLTLIANDTPIAAVKDTTFPGPGRAGVFVETFTLPEATINLDRLTARGFPDRNRVTDAAATEWDAFLRTQAVADRCDLLGAKRAGAIRDASLVSRCGAAVFVKLPVEHAARAYDRLLKAAGSSLEPVKGLPDCPHGTGIDGSLPPPTSSGLPVAPGIGRVACLDLGQTTAVVWLHAATGVIGVMRVDRDAHGAWSGYSRDWPPFISHPG